MTADSNVQSLRSPALPPAGIRRRQVLQMGLLLGMSGLSGCARAAAPTLMAAPETLPMLWRRRIAKPWQYKPLESIRQLEGQLPLPADLLALPDGWVPQLPPDALQSLGAPSLRERLSQQAVSLLGSFPPDLAAALLPVSVSPWVMVFRGDDDGPNVAKQGWRTLLEPGLAGQVVLPASPRLVLSLADHIDAPDALRRLRGAARVFDDRHALNWLLQGKARVAVLPLVRCMKMLRSDPRVKAVLPEQGAPLNWTLLMRPATTKEPLPQAWVEEAWSEPLLAGLLAEGWVPPLPQQVFRGLRASVPSRLRPVVLPPQSIWDRCWSLSPLSRPEAQQLAERWDDSTP